MTALPFTVHADGSTSLTPDLTEAKRLLDQGFFLVDLHPYQKRPVGDNWNKHPVQAINPKATGYGMPLAANNLCSIDPDQVEMARAGVAAWGFDLEDLLAQGVRTSSTRPGSGGRSAFAADEMEMLRWLPFAVFDDEGKSTTVLELRAKSENLQDCVPGVVYTDKRTGELCTQRYSNGKTFDEAPALPDAFARFWRLLSTDDEALREYTRQFVEAIAAAGHKISGKRPQFRPPMGSGEKLAFPSDYRGEYNRAQAVESVLDHNGYNWHAREQRYSHPAATGAPGIRPIPGKDGLWRSDHAGDPLHGTFDAWAAYVQLDHKGDLRAAEEAFIRAQHLTAQEEFDALTDEDASDPAETEQTAAFDLEAANIGDLLETDPPPREWLVQDRLPLGVVGLLAAAGGTGKSMVTLQLAISVCTGLPWLGMKMDQPGSVLVFSAEDDRNEVHRRLKTVVQLYREDVDPFDDAPFLQHIDSIRQRLYVFDRVGLDNRMTFKDKGNILRTGFIKRVIDTAAQVPDVKLIVLDPLARFDGGDPNDNADSTRLIECAEAVRMATGATVLLPHHVNKSSLKDSSSGQEAVRGGSGLVDGSRWVGLLAGMRPDESKKNYNIEPEEAGLYVRFTTPKANYSAPWAGMWLRRLAGGAMVPTEIKPARESKQEQRMEERYTMFLEVAKGLLERAMENEDPLTARKLRAFGGSAGSFKMGEGLLRGCINRAIDEGKITKDKEGYLTATY